MAAILKAWRQREIRLRQSMRIYVKNILARVHFDLIWNDWAFGFLKSSAQTGTTRWVAIWDQFLIETYVHNEISFTGCLQETDYDKTKEINEIKRK